VLELPVVSREHTVFDGAKESPAFLLGQSNR
jgi:hypothetical protein